MVEAKTSHHARRRQPQRRRSQEPARPGFTQSELWDPDRPVEVADAIRTLAALRERFERALELSRSRA